MERKVVWSRLTILVPLLVLLIPGCSPGTESIDDEPNEINSEAPLEVATSILPLIDAPTPTMAAEPTVAMELSPTSTAPPNVSGLENEGVITVTPTEVTVFPEANSQYRVVFVEKDDVLNVRSNLGVESGIVGHLAPGQENVEITGPAREAGGSFWVPVMTEGASGWVNSRYITAQVGDLSFCEEEEIPLRLEQLKNSISNRNGNELVELIDEVRGLRIRRHWWNPEVKLNQQQVEHIFISEEDHHWGIADGSGDTITDSFNSVILPILDRNLVGSIEIDCNRIQHGGTAGIVQLPFEYEGVNYYSLYRPADPEEIDLDWGTWVVGFEKGPSGYSVSFLVHYEWEI